MFGVAYIKVPGNIICRRSNDFYGIYNVLEPLLGHEEAEDAANWCEIASFDQEWESGGGSVRITIYED